MFFSAKHPQTCIKPVSKSWIATCTTAKKYYGFGMDTETLALIKKLEATNAAMDQLAIEVQKQCQAHISDIEESMADYRSFYLGDN